MNIHRLDCTDCPNFSAKKKCCHQSVIPVQSKSMAKAVEVAAKHDFDSKNWNYKRYAIPAYIKENLS